MLIWFTILNKSEPDGVSSGCHFQIKMRTGWNSSGCQTPRSENSSFVVDNPPPPKHQINYSNKQYHSQIANKHKKLLTYDLFEGLSEDLGERNEPDDLLLPCRQLQIQIRGSRGWTRCYGGEGVNRMNSRWHSKLPIVRTVRMNQMKD